MFDMSDWLNEYRALYNKIQWQDDLSPLPYCEAETAWLQDSTSLSKKLATYCEQLNVEVLANRDSGSELSYLENSWLREVLLLGDEKHWVYAQSAVEQSDLQNPVIRKLIDDDKPLGLALFSGQEVSRDQLQIGSIKHQDRLLWARRSRLTVSGSSIWVSELFLPQAPIYQLHSR